MNINITYQPTAKELAKASSLFVEKKPLLLFFVRFLNIITALFLIIFILKLFTMGLLVNESASAIVCLIWLFGRRPFNEWLLYHRMKRSNIVEKPIHVELSRNGIIWSGKGLKPGNMGWDEIKYILEAQNGFILPNALTRFLWLPFRGFQSSDQIQELRNFIQERKITKRLYTSWSC